MNDVILAIRDIVEGKQPHVDISDMLYNHGCLYLLSKIKNNSIIEKVALERTVNQISLKTRYKTCESIFEDLDNKKIPYAVIKGSVLSQMAYNDPLYRKSGDIDILVSRKDINSTKKILCANGFVQGRVIDYEIVPFTREELIFQAGTSHQVAPFMRETGNRLCPFVNVDVNLDIMWGESEQKTDMEYLLTKTDTFELYGVKCRKLSPEAEFVSLCMHHYKDMNSIYMLWTGHLKLSLFSDIFFYLKNSKPDIEKLRFVVRELNVTKFIYYCLYYTDIIFDSDEVKRYLSVFYDNTVENILNSYGLDEKERKKWNINFFERLLSNNLHMHLNESLTAKDKTKIAINQLYI